MQDPELSRPAIAEIRQTILEQQLGLDQAAELIETEFVHANPASEHAQMVGRIAFLAFRIEHEQRELQELVMEARAQGVMWADVGGAVGLSTSAALRRFDPEQKQKHAALERERYRAGSQRNA